MTITLLIGSLAVDIWLLIILHRQGVRKRLPWFVAYVAFGVLLESIELAAQAVGTPLYNAVHWWLEAVAVILIVGAVCESFLRIFRGFTKLPWFRWSVWAVIGAVVVYSAWKVVYAPPLHAKRIDVFVFDAEFLFRWGIVGIALLTTVLSFLLMEPMDTREDAVVTGFGIASLAFVLYVGSFSLFGTKYLFLTKYLPSVGYFLAIFWWIWKFSRPAEGSGFEELGIGPEDVLKIMRRDRETIKRMRESP